MDAKLQGPNISCKINPTRRPQLISDFSPQNFSHLGSLLGDLLVTRQLVLERRDIQYMKTKFQLRHLWSNVADPALDVLVSDKAHWKTGTGNRNSQELVTMLLLL